MDYFHSKGISHSDIKVRAALNCALRRLLWKLQPAQICQGRSASG